MGDAAASRRHHLALQRMQTPNDDSELGQWNDSANGSLLSHRTRFYNFIRIQNRLPTSLGQLLVKVGKFYSSCLTNLLTDLITLLISLVAVVLYQDNHFIESSSALSVSLSQVPEPLMNLLDKIFGLVSLSLYTYGERTTIDVAPKVAQDYRYLRLNASFYPELDEGNQIVNFSYSTDKKAEYFNQVSLPYGVRFDLSSTSIPQATRVAYENKVIRKIRLHLLHFSLRIISFISSPMMK